MQSTKQFSRYSDNVIDLTTTETHPGDKAYIVDQRFIDHFMKSYSKSTLADLKTDLKLIIDRGDTVEVITTNIGEYLYMHSVANHPNMPVPEPPVKEDRHRL